ncbi:hypothetical protein KUTeg_004409 [Tegillarca granosa]|uniref:Cadherin domain-containing protein n=1 Tax=Tegillarca granosa TaxID=220873 RepID=A0ABQ9FUD4_TEGGR|nr:hypothetical protein KUTeg_004409 [Tegillarca granosa]
MESVYENATIGTTVTTVTAKDPDNGLGGSVTYSMEAADEEYKNTFKIDPIRGHITIDRKLDYEKHNSYRFVITATSSLFSVIKGDYQNFDLNKTTGWITIKHALDRDEGEVRKRGGVYAMHVQVSKT